MITQETKPVKTWGGFNLAILKVNLNPLLERIEVHIKGLTSTPARLPNATNQ